MTLEKPTGGLALRISITDRCQFHCAYCRPHKGPALFRPEDLLCIADVVRFVRVAQDSLGVAKVRLTGGEPLLRPDVVALVAALAPLGIPDLAMTSNGQLLARLAQPLREAGLARMNVSLDSLKPETFRRLAQGGDLAKTLAGIDAALAAGLRPVRINTVVLRGINDHEAEDLVRFALARGCEPRFIELMPSGLRPEDFTAWFLSSAALAARLGESFSMTADDYVPASSSRRFRVVGGDGARGRVGFISPNSHPFCAGCRRLRLTADGRLMGCLGRKEHLRITALLRSQDANCHGQLAACLAAALACKRSPGAFAPAVPTSSIGG